MIKVDVSINMSDNGVGGGGTGGKSHCENVMP